jgi:hypothetical protein
MSSLQETTQFRIVELKLITSFNEAFDVTQIFDELNIFDNVFTPCMSGNILIKDAQNLINVLKLNGDEYLKITIDKGESVDEESFFFQKVFRIYKITNRRKESLTSESYVLHFFSPEFLLSQQIKVNQFYNGSYTNIAKSILTDYLRVPDSSPGNGLSGIQNFLPSLGIFEIIVPNLSPFSAIDWLAKRATGVNNKPDYLFFETQFGYNFNSLSWYFQLPSRYQLNFNPKNLNQGDKYDLFGVRDMKILSQTNTSENVFSGVYSGTFFGFDPLTRTIKINQYSHDDIFKSQYANRYPNLANDSRAVSTERMFDSRVITYPFQLPRMETNPASEYIKDNYPTASNFIDNTHEYVLQRKAILQNLMQKRLRLVMAGNFGLFSGTVVQLEFPKYASFDEGETERFDDTMRGKYIILGARHIIRYEKHETVIEIATDSTNREM